MDAVERGFQTWNIACRPAISIYDKPRYRYFIEKKGWERGREQKKNQEKKYGHPPPLQLIWNVFEKMLKYEIWPLGTVDFYWTVDQMLRYARTRLSVGPGTVYSWRRLFQWQRIGFPHSESASVRSSTHRSRPHWPKAPWRHPATSLRDADQWGGGSQQQEFLFLNSPRCRSFYTDGDMRSWYHGFMTFSVDHGLCMKELGFDSRDGMRWWCSWLGVTLMVRIPR